MAKPEELTQPTKISEVRSAIRILSGKPSGGISRGSSYGRVTCSLARNTLLMTRITIRAM